MVKDAIGRSWQLTTVQLDFNQPENFDMNYTAEDGQKHRPAVLHVAILGSVERFLGVLIEHYAGAFPLWLSPAQIIILPIGENQVVYAKKVCDALLAANPGLRIEIDDRAESVGKKIREAAMQKIPYQLIVGEKEVEAGKVAVRLRDGSDLGQMPITDFAERVKDEIKNKY
jgi:threonyl-tRNA synthetase